VGKQFNENENLLLETTDRIDEEGWHWNFLVRLSKLGDYLDSEGAMTLRISLDAFYHDPATTNDDTGGVATTMVRNEDLNLSLEEKFLVGKEPVHVNKVACLLGDKETSDVSICVVNEKDEEIGSFPCHSAILAGYSHFA